MSSRLQGLAGLLAVEATVEETDPVESIIQVGRLPSNQDTPVLIPLAKIRKSPFQPRAYFNREKIQIMADKFRQYREAGVRPKTVILVRPIIGEDGYELVFGEQRKIASEEAGYDDVLAFVDSTITDAEARELALTENLLREDLNPIEKTEGILNLAAIRIGSSPEGVKQLLDKAANERKQGADNVIRSQQWKALELFFEELPDKITPESFRTNYLPLLNLPPDVLMALHQGKLEYTKAKAIAGVKSDTQRQRLLEDAVKHNLPIRVIRDRIRESKIEKDGELKALNAVSTISSRISQLSRKARQSTALGQAERRKEVELLLSRLEELLND